MSQPGAEGVTVVQSAAGLPDGLGVLPGGRVLGVDATARELSSVVDRMRVLGLVDDGVANVLRRSLTRPADAADFTLAWRAAVPAATAREIARRYRQALDSPVTRDMAARMGLEVSASVGPGGANHPDDVAKVRRFLTDEGFETPRTTGLDPATALLAAYLKDGAHNPRLTPADAAAIRDTLVTISDQRSAVLDATEVREAHDTIERIGAAFTDADDGQPVPEDRPREDRQDREDREVIERIGGLFEDAGDGQPLPDAPPLVDGPQYPATREVAGLRQPHVLVAERQLPPTSADVTPPHPPSHPTPATPPVMTPVGLSFAKGSTTLAPSVKIRIIETARDLAATLDARHRQGLQPPVVTVTGSGEGRLTAAATGRARATAVADELHRRLTEELDRLDSPAHATIRTRTTGSTEAPAALFPGWSADARRQTAVISLDHTPVADHLNLLETRTGVLIGDPRPYSTATNQRHQHALDHLPHRDDTYVVAMHIGDTGAPISPEQLADVLRAAYDSGKLDGKTRIDFLSCRLGALTERHVPQALSALWAHQQANPRPGVSGPLTGRAPVGDVWVLPKMVNGEADFTTDREVIVADHVGIDTHGKPVIVLGPESLWRTYTHSGDTDHTPHTTLSGGHLTPHGDTDHHLPTGYTNHRPTHPTDPTHTLQPLDGASKFGPNRRALMDTLASRQAEFGDAAVPVPVSLAPVSVLFARGSTELGEGSRGVVAATARRLAPELAERHRQGRALPRVMVTGRGDGSALNGPARAAETVGELRTRLREELAALGVDVEPPIDVVLPKQVEQALVRQLSTTIALDYAGVADTLHLQHTESGVLVTGPARDMPGARGEARSALDRLPQRGDVFVVGMHVGRDGTPVGPKELADVLLAAYDGGRLDGRSRIDFVSCRLGSVTERHVPEAMAALWAHQAANPRPGVAGAFIGRAPVGDVWVVPKVVGAVGDFGADREVVVADHVGIDAHGRPVVVRSETSVWRTFADTGEAAHTARHQDGADVPEGYRVQRSADSGGPGRGLEALDGAVRFGPDRQPKRSAGHGAAPHDRPDPKGPSGGPEVRFLQGVPQVFQVTAGGSGVKVNGRIFDLPKKGRARFQGAL
ncbi:hypothetical protein, partial [Kitasatospora sp. NPDC002522]